MVKSPIIKCYLCNIVVMDSITSISNFDWQHNGSEFLVKSIDCSNNVVNKMYVIDDVHYIQLRQERLS